MAKRLTQETLAEKALLKILSGTSDNNVTLDELIAVLSREGFCHDGGRGSHQQVWRHPDGRKVILPRHGNSIKPIYVKTVRGLLKE